MQTKEKNLGVGGWEDCCDGKQRRNILKDIESFKGFTNSFPPLRERLKHRFMPFHIALVWQGANTALFLERSMYILTKC